MPHCRRHQARRVMLVAALTALTVAAALLSGAHAAARQNDPRVTLFGDSIAAGLYWQPVLDVLSEGVDLNMQAAACRRIEDTGCPIGNVVPAPVLEVITGLHDDLGATVVMVIGYNEFTGDWVQSVTDVLARFKQDGVKHVFWLTLREAQHDNIWMNQQLGTFAPQHPELTILDWNTYSRSHPEWFQGDGEHLLPDGAFAMASFIHSALVDAGIAQPPAPPPGTSTTQSAQPVAVVTRVLPAAAHDRIYRALLTARGGKPPYRWRRAGRLPQGFHLASDGLVTGIPRVAPGKFTVPVIVTDAKGDRASRRVVVRIF